MIVAHLKYKGIPVADVTYRAGLHVEVRVAKEFQLQTVDFLLIHSGNCRLSGNWEQALDKYFNEGIFDSKDFLFPGEMRRIGSAREHRSLFNHAARALLKDLQPHGFHVEVIFL
jgi:hypothetical protein